MAKPSKYYHSALESQVSPSEHFAVNPMSDTANLPYASREIRVATAGDVKVVRFSDDADVTVPFLAGEKLAIVASKIYASGTTATGIVVLY